MTRLIIPNSNFITFKALNAAESKTEAEPYPILEEPTAKQFRFTSEDMDSYDVKLNNGKEAIDGKDFEMRQHVEMVGKKEIVNYILEPYASIHVFFYQKKKMIKHVHYDFDSGFWFLVFPDNKEYKLFMTKIPDEAKPSSLKIVEITSKQPSIHARHVKSFFYQREPALDKYSQIDILTASLSLDDEWLGENFVFTISNIPKSEHDVLVKKWDEEVNKWKNVQKRYMAGEKISQSEISGAKWELSHAKEVLDYLKRLCLAEDASVDWNIVKETSITKDGKENLPNDVIERMIVKPQAFIPILIKKLKDHVTDSNELYYDWEEIFPSRIEDYANAMLKLFQLTNKFDKLKTTDFKLLDTERISNLMKLAEEIKDQIKEINNNVSPPDLDDIWHGLDTFSTRNAGESHSFHAKYPLRVREIIDQLENGILPITSPSSLKD